MSPPTEGSVGLDEVPGRGVERLIVLSDGVVAIAITLLVLPLADLEAPDGATVTDVLRENAFLLVAFGLSFAVIANYWMVHNDIMKRVLVSLPAFTRLNLLWLAGIVLIPFPTAMLRYGVEDGFGTLYLVSLLAVSLVTMLMLWHQSRHPETLTAADPGATRTEVITSGANVVALAIATLVSLVRPSLGLWCLLLLIPAQTLTRRLT